MHGLQGGREFTGNKLSLSTPQIASLQDRNVSIFKVEIRSFEVLSMARSQSTYFQWRLNPRTARYSQVLPRAQALSFTDTPCTYTQKHSHVDMRPDVSVPHQNQYQQPN